MKCKHLFLLEVQYLKLASNLSCSLPYVLKTHWLYICTPAKWQIVMLAVYLMTIFHLKESSRRENLILKFNEFNIEAYHSCIVQ